MAMGRCPLCEGAVEVGSPCLERVCQRQGYHGIPEECFRRMAEGSGEDRDPVVGRLVGGEFLVVSRLGAGGFGRVYRALQRPVDQVVALKVMHREGTDGALASSLARRFEGEARALASLSHPNVVRLIKFGTHGELPYLAMEYVPGQTLRERLVGMAGRGEELEEGVVRHLVDEVLGALEAAHGVSLVHRDLKPENLMIQEIPGDRWFVKVLDFGLAKFVEARTETSLVMGTPQYMAPEQIARRDIGPWTDLYALGAMTFEWVTGRRPFAGRTTQEILGRKLDPGYDVGSRVADLGMPEAALAFFRRSMARDPRERYRSAGEFREGFEGLWSALTGGGTTVRVGGDLTGLVDPSDLVRQSEEGRRLREERERLEREKAEVERARAEAEKAREEAERVRSEVEAQRRQAEKASGAEGRVAGKEGMERPAGTGQAIQPRSGGRWWPLVLGMTVVAGTGGIWWYREATTAAAARAEGARAAAVARKAVIEWVRIPGGRYRMGSEKGDSNEKPVHWVEVGSFEMARTEVTVGQYRECVAAGVCSEPGTGDGCNWGVAGREDHPVNCVDWGQAREFSKWVGGRLPSESEWEYAARSGGKDWEYPWGDEGATCERAVMDDGGDGCGQGGTWAVCSKPKGNTEQGLCDMSGNVWEWVQDWYHESYEGAPSDGSAWEIPAGQYRVNRGGSWNDFARCVRAALRRDVGPGLRNDFLGFRPARPVR